MFNQRVPHIVYASDDGFAEILGVSLVSLYENSRDAEDIVVYVLDSGISDDNRDKLSSISEKYGRSSIRFISAKNISKILSMNVNTDRGSLSQYARLFVSSDLPDDLERVLYLDCDIIVNSSITPLWSVDMSGNTIAALKDAFSRQYRRNIGLEPHDVMFNSGVMLIDLVRWKEKKIEKRLLGFIKKHHGKIQQGDQGALYAVLSKDTLCLHPKFNSVTIFYDFTYPEIMTYRKPVDYYSPEEVREAVEAPVLIHYTTSFLSTRPWYEGCGHKYRDRWLEYKALSPWKDTPLWKPKKESGLKGMYIKACKKAPRKPMIWFSGLLQAYGRPLMYRR